MTIISEDSLALAALPTPEHMTLLFKFHKQTVLLSVLPITPFSEIKSLLLAALRSRNIDAIAGSPLPDDAKDVELGVLVDKKDPSKGWLPLDDGGAAEPGKLLDGSKAAAGKKKKATAAGGKKGGVVNNDSPAGASLGDAAILAFRFRHQEEERTEDDEGDDSMEIEKDPGWNVVLPSFEDQPE